MSDEQEPRKDADRDIWACIRIATWCRYLTLGTFLVMLGYVVFVPGVKFTTVGDIAWVGVAFFVIRLLSAYRAKRLCENRYGPLDW